MDLLVTLSETPTLYEFVNLKRYLEDVLEREVDLGMPSAMKEGPAPRRREEDMRVETRPRSLPVLRGHVRRAELLEGCVQ